MEALSVLLFYPTAFRKPWACLSVVRLEPGVEARLGIPLRNSGL
jgi:hypothetical protein